MPTKTKSSSNGKRTYKPPDEVRIVINQVQETGTSGLKTYAGYVQEAYNASLYWPQCAPIYTRLRANPTTTMIWRAFQAWGRQIEPVIDLPDQPSDDDKKYKDFLLSDFENMEGGFGQYMDIASYRPVMDGFYVWDVQPGLRDPNWVPPVPKGQDEDEWRSQEGDGLIGIRRIAPRDNNSFLRWQFNSRKKAVGMWQQDFPSPAVMIPLDHNHGLHHTIGNPNNPEGTAGLEPVWRLERIQYGLQVIQGIGFEHAAGHLSVKRTESGTLSDKDIAMVQEAAKNLLSAQEGNYGFWPYGIEGEIVDTNFQAASTILEAIKYYDILMLSVFMMQTIALNTLTNTGALTSQVDTSDMAVFTFNSMIDGLATQYDQQIGKRLYEWNRNSFPGITKRPKIRFSHVERNIALATVGSFLQQVNGILPLSEDDYIAIRKRTGFLPENNPNPVDQADQIRTMDQNREPVQPQDGNPSRTSDVTTVTAPEAKKQFSGFSFTELGGEGSGNWGHAGRPGEVGGSSSESNSSEHYTEGKVPKKITNDITKTWSGDRKAVALGTINSRSKNDISVIRDGDEVVGIIGFRPQRTIYPPEGLEGRYEYVDGIATKRPGYGRQAMQIAVDRARENNSGLLLTANNAPIGFYQKLGMNQLKSDERTFYWTPEEIQGLSDLK